MSGLENFAKDLGAQQYWVRRLVAYIIDAFLVAVVLALLGVEAFPYRAWSIFTVAGLVLFPDSVLLEWSRGQTVGKWVMRLRVVGIREKVDLPRLLVREISKVHPVALGLDILAGVLAEKNGKQRYLEILSDTTEVVDKAPVTSSSQAGS